MKKIIKIQWPKLRYNHVLILRYHDCSSLYHSRTLHRQPWRSFMSFSSILESPFSSLEQSFLMRFCVVRATRSETSLEKTKRTAKTTKAILANLPRPRKPFLMYSRRPLDLRKAYSVSLADDEDSSSWSFLCQNRRIKGIKVALLSVRKRKMGGLVDKRLTLHRR